MRFGASSTSIVSAIAPNTLAASPSGWAATIGDPESLPARKG